MHLRARLVLESLVQPLQHRIDHPAIDTAHQTVALRGRKDHRGALKRAVRHPEAQERLVHDGRAGLDIADRHALERQQLRVVQRLLDDGVDAAAVEAVEAEQAVRVDAAEETAKNSGPPPLESAMTELWADGGSSWRN